MRRTHLPRSVPSNIATAAIMSLFALQVSTGTGVTFAFMVAVFLAMAVLAFNFAEGLSTVPGVCVAAITVKVLLLSQVMKVVLWQAADSNLRSPDATIGVLTLGMAGLVVASIVSRREPTARPILPAVTEPRTLKYLGVTCGLLGSTSFLFPYLLAGASGALGLALGAAVYMRTLSPVAVACFTARRIELSSGRRAIDGYVVASVGFELIFGMLLASKQTMYEPFLAHGLACFAFSFRFRSAHVFGWLGVMALAVVVLYPISQFGRTVFKQESLTKSFSSFAEFASEYLSDWESFEQIRQATTQYEDREKSYDPYFGASYGILDRFSLIHPADLLISESIRTGPLGVGLMLDSLQIVPKSLSTGDDGRGYGVVISKMTGLISETDDETSIAVTAFADAFALESWAGAATLPLLLFVAFFFAMNQIAPTLDRNVWAVGFATVAQHGTAEVQLGTLLFYIFRILPVIVVVSYFLIRVVASLGSETHASKRRVRKEKVFE